MDLTTIEGRGQFINYCNESLLEELRGIGLDLSEKAVVFIGFHRVIFGVKYDTDNNRSIDFGSDIIIYFDEENPSIEIGSSGAFDPFEKDSSYWKTLQSAELIKNWDIAVSVIKKWHFEYCKLRYVSVKKSEKK